MKYIWMTCFLLMGLSVAGQEMKTEIRQVTVYLEGAQVTRTGNTSLKRGDQELLITGLSPYIDEKSIQVKGEGDFTLIGVKHSLNFLDKVKRDEQVARLEQQLEEADAQIQRHMFRLDVLKEKQNLLHSNKNLGGLNGISVEDLEKAVGYYDKALSDISREQIDIADQLETLKQNKLDLQKEVSQLTGEEEPTGEIRIRVSSEQPVEAALTVSYVVENARWFPSYDIRVTSIDEPVHLDYKATIIQHTGEDWEQVKLRLSNGNPHQGGNAPELIPWKLGLNRPMPYIRNIPGQVSGIITSSDGEPLPGVNVTIKGTTVGTVSDVDGSYSITSPANGGVLVYSFVGLGTQERPISSGRMDVSLTEDVMHLEEVVVTGYALQGRAAGVQVRGASSIYGSRAPDRETLEDIMADMEAITYVNQTTVEFEVDRPYTIKSNRESVSVDLKNHRIEALYEYYSVPKVDKDAFLMARIPNWDRFNLLDGEANLYYEGTFVGRTILDSQTLSDTLALSLGRDRSIVVSRDKVDDFTVRRNLGSNRVESRGFEIVVRNKKAQPVNLVIYDQVPLSSYNMIQVKPSKLDRGELHEASGKIKWQLRVPPNAQDKVIFAYEVKYPKKMDIYLE